MVRVAPAQAGQSLEQLADVYTIMLITVQLLEEKTPALLPLPIPPYMVPGRGGKGGSVAASAAA